MDIIAALIQQPDYQVAGNYWKVLKNRLKKEGSESVTKCNRLKLPAGDGKSYLTDVAAPETLLRLIQSVPSPKAEPIKLWLAKVAYERMQDMSDPARSLDRARDYWRQHGRSEKWIQQRMMGQETRNKLTDYWKDHEISGEQEYAILTNIIHQEWSGVYIKKHKDIKGLKTQNLRDHMSEAELIFTIFFLPTIRNFMLLDLEHLREEYAERTLDAAHAYTDPFIQLQHWLKEALEADLPEPNAMTLATCTADGMPSARVVLLKGLESSGLDFYTNYHSRKGHEMKKILMLQLLFCGWGCSARYE